MNRNVSLLAIFAENRTGQLARVTRVLAQAGVNIRWVIIASTESFGVVKVLVDQTDMAYRRLKEDGLPVSRVEVLAVEVEDRPGGLLKIADELSRRQINIENASGFVTNQRAVLLIEVKELDRARQALEAVPLRLLTEQETLRL